MNNKLIEKFISLVNEMHSGQTRKYRKIPQCMHPIEVATRLIRWGITDDHLIVAALLHDVLEDCDITEDKLKNRICKIYQSEDKDLESCKESASKIIGLVRELTYDKSVYKTKNDYIESFSKCSQEALLIKIVDRITNTLDFIYNGERQYAAKYFELAAVIVRRFTLLMLNHALIDEDNIVKKLDPEAVDLDLNYLKMAILGVKNDDSK